MKKTNISYKKKAALTGFSLVVILLVSSCFSLPVSIVNAEDRTPVVIDGYAEFSTGGNADGAYVEVTSSVSTETTYVGPIGGWSSGYWQVDVGTPGPDWPDGTSFTVTISTPSGWIGSASGVTDGPNNNMGTIILMYTSDSDGDWDYTSNSPHMFSNVSGNVGIGTSNPQYKLDVAESLRIKDSGNYAKFFMNSFSNTNWHGNFLFNSRYRGTESSPAAVQNGDTIFNFDLWGYDGSNTQRCGQISGQVGGGVSSNIVPGKWIFKTTDTSGNLGNRMVLTANGNIGINQNNPENKLHVDGAINLDPISEPNNPTEGFVLYCDSTDGKLKAKSSSGTITTLANP